jgi:hypothetical protein
MVCCTKMNWFQETVAQAPRTPLALVVACIPQVPGNVRARFRTDGKGGGVLDLGYRGPLVSSSPVWIRIGETRGGLAWLGSRDLLMESCDGQVIAHVVFAPGVELDGISFAFHVARPGGGERVWDNAGRQFGCYTLDLATGEIAAR